MKHEITLASLRSREGIALLFALSVVLLIGFLSYRGWTALGLHADQHEVTQQTVTQIDALLASLTDAETGQRGFLLTGEDRYIEPYLRARADIPVLLKSLAAVTIGHPDQARRLDSLVPLVNQKLAELDRTIEVRRNQGLDAALALVRTDLGIELTDRVRSICRAIETAAIELVTRYSVQARSSAKQGALISILGSACLFLFLLAAMVDVQKGVARSRSLIGKLQQSERRLRETAAEAQAASRAKSTFLSTMSHEIRTPMNAILGYVQLMLRDPNLGTDAQVNLRIIGRSGDHLLSLINDVLDMASIEAGRIEIKPVTFNLSGLLNDLEAMFRLRAAAKALRFEMLVDGESVPYILADEGRMRQALINLLGNAVKFTESGEIELHVTLDYRAANRLWLSARVADTGPGIPYEDQKRLFEPFSQLERNRGKTEGTGLGLAISRKYARLMGGDVTLISIPGTGSVFLFEIPIERGDSGVALKANAPRRRVVGIHAGSNVPRILVVDDQVDNRDWLMKLLMCIGFSVRGADNGETAIRSWEEWNPQLILMDVHMPVMDGLEASRRIKADPRGKDTAIVVLTASVLDEDRRIVAQTGADRFLAKPCRDDELLETIRTLLNITYNYKEAGASQGENLAAAAPLTAAGIAQIPGEQLEEIRHAALTGNKKHLDEAILRVCSTAGAGSAPALQELADNYDYGTLTRLLAISSGPLPEPPRPLVTEPEGTLTR